MSELRGKLTHKKLAEHPDSPVTFEFEPCHCFKWSITANPVPGHCYELCLNAECDVTDAPENSKDHLEGKYHIRLTDEKTHKTLLYYSEKLASGSTTVTREVPKNVLENENTKIVLIVEVERALGLDEEQGEPHVKLDIGGTKFVTTPTTICKYFSRLKRDFKFYREPDHIWKSILKSDDFKTNFRVRNRLKDELYYDRDSKYFRYILNFLRDGEDITLPKNREKIEEILKEAKFWMLKELEDLCQRKLEISSDFELLNI
ncbi:hypothetical protein B9Z55_007652 [Caenorhabditis nigoni]|uniref:BTB domain-containing protein n=1 Tax=Caenorhabditis nigoni TaxID=1611254 RepID=A0A2G5VAR2_9PELO|nr:hypothetical protein B9Z55_007652 [Caenorhabditis nigoni]